MRPALRACMMMAPTTSTSSRAGRLATGLRVQTSLSVNLRLRATCRFPTRARTFRIVPSCRPHRHPAIQPHGTLLLPQSAVGIWLQNCARGASNLSSSNHRKEALGARIATESFWRVRACASASWSWTRRRARRRPSCTVPEVSFRPNCNCMLGIREPEVSFVSLHLASRRQHHGAWPRVPTCVRRVPIY